MRLGICKERSGWVIDLIRPASYLPHTALAIHRVVKSAAEDGVDIEWTTEDDTLCPNYALTEISPTSRYSDLVVRIERKALTLASVRMLKQCGFVDKGENIWSWEGTPPLNKSSEVCDECDTPSGHMKFCSRLKTGPGV